MNNLACICVCTHTKVLTNKSGYRTKQIKKSEYFQDNINLSQDLIKECNKIA